jgi:hypothetical protein
MISRKEILDTLNKGNAEWATFVANLTMIQLSDILKTVGDMQNDFKTAIERMEQAQGFIKSELETRQLQTVRARRKETRAKPKTSLRGFLMQPQTEEDISLKNLPLCTKSGAPVALCALTFRTGEDGQRTEMTNQAKELFQLGVKPADPIWDLYYVKDGERSPDSVGIALFSTKFT